MIKELQSPCKNCPWRKTTPPGALGGSEPEVYIGQAHGPFKIPCHMTCDFEDPEWIAKSMVEASQCAGAAMYRHAQGLTGALPAPLTTIEPDGSSWTDPAEFIAHHREEPIEKVRAVMEFIGIKEMMQIELVRASQGPYTVTMPVEPVPSGSEEKGA